MLIDTHMHLSCAEDTDTILNEARNNNVKRFIISGCDDVGIKDALELIKKYDDVYATIGYHPSEAQLVKDSDLLNLEQAVRSNKKVVGLGEIGLDYHYGKDNRNKQINLFEKQLKIAERLNVPVVIHSRDAFQDTYDILKKYHVTGVIHCFSGSLEAAKLYLSLGYSLGIGGVVTFKNSKLSSVITDIPIQSIVLETDSPYLAPEPYRGSRNGPKNIPIIAKKISEIKNISYTEMERITSLNACTIFDLKI